MVCGVSVFGLGGSFLKREPEVRCHEVKSESTIVISIADLD
jgi:hypothetical protein